MTRAGYGALTVALVATGIGLGASWPGVLLLGIVAWCLLAAGAIAVARRPSLHLERTIEPSRVSRGQPALILVQFSNLAKGPTPRTLAIQRLGDREVAAQLPKLRGGESGIRTFELPTEYRGRFAAPPIEVARVDAFGLYRRIQRFGDSVDLWVQPADLGFRALPAGRLRDLEGPNVDRAPNGSIAFHHLRDYVVGDDLRMVHWKSSARKGQLVVRQNVDTPQPQVTVLVDLRPQSHDSRSFELAIDAAASAIRAGYQGGAPLRIRTTSGGEYAVAVNGDLTPVLDHLTVVEPDAVGNLVQLLDEASRQRSMLMLVGGMLDDREIHTLASHARRFDGTIVLQTQVQSTMAWPGAVIISDSEPSGLTAQWNAQVAR